MNALQEPYRDEWTTRIETIRETLAKTENSKRFEDTQTRLRSLLRAVSFDDSSEPNWKKSAETLLMLAISDAQWAPGIRASSSIQGTLYLLGNYALQLIITTYLFENFPAATPSDMHLMRACVSFAFHCRCSRRDDSQSTQVFSDDALAAIVVENNFHQFLCPQPNDAFSSALLTIKTSVLVGGRIAGKDAKLMGTESVVSAFKRFVGALALSLGLESTGLKLLRLWEKHWRDPNYLRRSCYKESSLVRSYS